MEATRISSGITGVYRIWTLFCGIGLVGSVVLLLKQNIVPALLCGIMGVFLIVLWWKYLRAAANVFINGEGLHIVNEGNARIRYDSIVSIDLAPGMLVGTVVINYKDVCGTERQLCFVPSIQAGGLFFTAEHIREMIKAKMPDLSCEK